MKIRVSAQKEKAPSAAADPSKLKKPSYGRTLEEFREGDVYVHPRGLTVTAGSIGLFATTFHEGNPLHLNQEFAKAMGYAACPAPAQLVFNIVLSLGVQNDSEKAIANLGYYDASFVRPVMPGDTLRSLTKVLGVKLRGEGQPGIVSIRTVGLNQRDEIVLQYDRKILVAIGDAKKAALLHEEPTTRPTVALGFPQLDPPVTIDIPEPKKAPRNLTGARTWLEDFKPGEIYLHANGRTVSDEHMAWTYRVGNTHPLHFDRVYTKGLKGPMSGEPVVYGGLVFAWLDGLASRDTTENALWTVGFTEGYHTQPVVAGDTLYAISRVLDAQTLGSHAKGKDAAANLKAFAGDAVADGELEAGLVTFQLIGLKNMTPAQALEAHGAALFEKEQKKDTKIKEKVFEIEKRVLIRSRG